MKTLNLVMAIIYSGILAWMFLTAIIIGDSDMAFGCVLLSGPVVVNWITYSNLKKK